MLTIKIQYNTFTFNDPLELAFIIIGAPLGGLGGNGGRLGLLECGGSGQIGSDSNRFLSCIYSSIKLSTFVSMSSTLTNERKNNNKKWKNTLANYIKYSESVELTHLSFNFYNTRC